MRTVMTGLILALILGGCKGASSPSNLIGVVTFLKGKAAVVRGTTRTPLSVNSRLKKGDVVETEAKSVAIVVFNRGAAEMEIQPKARIEIQQFSTKKKVLALKRGNLWLRVNKRGKNEEFTLRSPTAIAGVRGTKFYTFTVKDPKGRTVHGTCHCQGSVHFKAGKYSAVHQGDFVVLTRGKKTILLTPKDLAFMGPNAGAHQHSELKKSPLGPRAVQMTPKQALTFMRVAEKKFKAAR